MKFICFSLLLIYINITQLGLIFVDLFLPLTSMGGKAMLVLHTILNITGFNSNNHCDIPYSEPGRPRP